MEHLAKEAKEGRVERVLFLMPCHATPFYSSLHKNVSMRFLDCSPRYSLLMGEHTAFFSIWKFLTLLTVECTMHPNHRSLLSTPKSVKLYTHMNPFPWVLFFKLLINYRDQSFDPRYGCRSAASVATFHWNVWANMILLRLVTSQVMWMRRTSSRRILQASCIPCSRMLEETPSPAMLYYMIQWSSVCKSFFKQRNTLWFVPYFPSVIN